MPKIYLNASQVKMARRRCWQGETVKAVAAAIKQPYGVVYMAVRGQSWSSITNPPPLPPGRLHENRCKPARQGRPCCNCGQRYTGHSSDGRCSACYSFRYRNGHDKPAGWVWSSPKKIVIPAGELLRLYEQYRGGKSVERLAEGKPFSAETLRRAFKSAGFTRRLNNQLNQKLTAELVRRARDLHYQHGVTVKELSLEFEVSYQTLHSAIKGHTWLSVPGLPVVTNAAAARPCKLCGILTDRPSGVCVFCH